MDGIRAFWDGHRLMSKHGKRILCPSWLTEELPSNIALDGELWMGRGSIQSMLKVFHGDKENLLWKEVEYVIFDLPHSQDCYELRMKELREIKLPSHARAIKVKQCINSDHLREYLDEILKLGGEGLILNKPLSYYTPSRSSSVIKLKPHQDVEVQLVEILPTGLSCLQTNGIRCIVGCSVETINSPPTIGSFITVKHSGYYKNGNLRNPFFWRIRSDYQPSLSGDNEDQGKLVRTLLLLSDMIAKVANWTEWKNRRDFFDNLGKLLDLKELSSFYSMKVEEIHNRGGSELLENVYKGSLLTAIKDVYPNRKWLAWKMKSVPLGFWGTVGNQRAFMDWLGIELGYKEMKDWYQITFKQILEKGGSGLLHRYENSPSNLVLSVYSNHNWDGNGFIKYWNSKRNQKEMMNQIGKELGFVRMEDWYQITAKKIEEKGGSSLLKHKYGGSPSKLVMSMYPNYKWNQFKFNRRNGGTIKS